jgi:hypothetical protein
LRSSLEISTKLRFVRKVAFRVLLANPSENVEVGGEPRESHCLLEVTRRKCEDQGERNSQPEVGGSEKEIVIATVGEEVRERLFEIGNTTNYDEVTYELGDITL